MRERVDLNSNGNSIESPGKIFKRDKWTTRYIVCKKPSDVRAPIFMVFKSVAARNNNNFKASFALQNYVGLETGFELKKQANTLAILTKEEVIILAFALPENLIIWESWLKNTCGQSQCFFVQLQRAPLMSTSAPLLKKEIRMHLHDSRFALVHGRPQIMLEFAEIDESVILSHDQNTFAFATKSRKTKHDYYIVSSPRMHVFYSLLEKAAAHPNGLHMYLSSRNCDGDWMPQAYTRQHDSASLPPESVYNLHSPIRYLVSNLDKGKSKSGYHFGGADRMSGDRGMMRASSVANYYNTCGLNSPRLEAAHSVGNTNYVNCQQMPHSSSRQSSFRSRIFFPSDTNGTYCNLQQPSTSAQPKEEQSGGSRCLSLPDYVNVDAVTTPTVPSPRTPRQHKTSQPLYSNVSMYTKSNNNNRIRRRSDNSVSFGNLHERANPSKQRSMVEFSTSEQFAGERYENWKRAKKFISSFKSKGDQGTPKRSIIKANSTSALTFASQSRRELHSSCSSDLSSQLDDELPQSLNIGVHNGLLREGNGEMEAPQGLVKVREEFPFLNSRSGVGAILAKRLQSTVRGSFSKYDGERATHHYTPNENDPPKDDKQDDPLDGIMSAVKSGQERLKQSDRRASTVSFKQNVILLPRRASRNQDSNRLKVEGNEARHSTSYSENTRSSNDSLSSDARSRISIKKRSNSPPKMMAPRLDQRELSQHTLTIHISSSVDSLNSEQTARSSSPIALPRRITRSSTNSIQSDLRRNAVNYCDLAAPKKAGSSSSNSVNSRVDYVIIDPVSTKAVQEACARAQQSIDLKRSQSTTLQDSTRRSSHGQSSVSDTVSLGNPTRQGFFRKYRKMRRSKKDNAASTGQLNF